MVMLEAAGKLMYDDLVASDRDPKIREILVDCGREEYLHAERVNAAIGKLTGDAYPVPTSEENPYLVAWVNPSSLTSW